MKKAKFLIVMGCLINLLFVSSGYSAGTASAQVLVTVASLFDVNIDRQLIDFHSMRPGETKDNAPDEEGVKVTCRSNSGNPWYLKINTEQELSDGKNVIPNSNFFWYGAKSPQAAGTWYGTGRDFFTTEPVLAYASSLAEANNAPSGTDVFFKFKLTIPEKQPRGIYKTAVVFTLTE